MSSEGSVTAWLSQLKAGDPNAARRLWECYFQPLVELARQKLQGMPRSARDEEDVVLSAFDSFCRGARAGRFPQLFDRDSLWRLLVTLTKRKAVDLRRHEARQKRGGSPGDDEGHHPPAAAPREADWEDLPSAEPTPEFALLMTEECQRLLGLLDHSNLRIVALCKMEGYTTEEIAARLGCVPRTIERKVQMIRQIWTQASPG